MQTESKKGKIDNRSMWQLFTIKTLDTEAYKNAHTRLHVALKVRRVHSDTIRVKITSK